MLFSHTWHGFACAHICIISSINAEVWNRNASEQSAIKVQSKEKREDWKFGCNSASSLTLHKGGLKRGRREECDEVPLSTWSVAASSRIVCCTMGRPATPRPYLKHPSSATESFHMLLGTLVKEYILPIKIISSHYLHDIDPLPYY
jgi:hypothetical protein